MALKESEKLYKSIFKTTGTATSMLEDGITISHVNREWTKLYGYTATEAVGLHWQKLVAPESRGLIQSNIVARKLNPKAVPRSYEIRAMDKKGKIKDVILTTCVIPKTNIRIVSSPTLLNASELKNRSRCTEAISKNL